MAKKAAKPARKRAVPASIFAEFPFEAGKDYRIEFASGQSSTFHGGALLANRFFEKAQVRTVKEVETGKVIYRE